VLSIGDLRYGPAEIREWAVRSIIIEVAQLELMLARPRNVAAAYAVLAATALEISSPGTRISPDQLRHFTLMISAAIAAQNANETDGEREHDYHDALLEAAYLRFFSKPPATRSQTLQNASWIWSQFSKHLNAYPTVTSPVARREASPTLQGRTSRDQIKRDLDFNHSMMSNFYSTMHGIR
jgi:hypothetical protein